MLQLVAVFCIRTTLAGSLSANRTVPACWGQLAPRHNYLCPVGTTEIWQSQLMILVALIKPQRC